MIGPLIGVSVGGAALLGAAGAAAYQSMAPTAQGFGRTFAHGPRGSKQIALTYEFKSKPKGADVFDASFLPPAADRKAN